MSTVDPQSAFACTVMGEICVRQVRRRILDKPNAQTHIPSHQLPIGHFLTLFIPSASDLEQCEPSWEKFQGFCYRHFTKRQSWEVAEQHCRLCGGHLISVMTPEEQDYINGKKPGTPPLKTTRASAKMTAKIREKKCVHHQMCGENDPF